MLKIKPYRSKAYRMRVASLPCFHCGIWGLSQCAHSNTRGKGLGLKASDLDTFPLCATRPGVSGCHADFDQGRLIPKADRPEWESRAIAWTRAALAAGE